ncbi:hypothetical protein FRC02_012076 [Tulasnella sp. 418]|nr:hypothetical protein FRC02_012076 [Tulasnella sp. 418]
MSNQDTRIKSGVKRKRVPIKHVGPGSSNGGLGNIDSKSGKPSLSLTHDSETYLSNVRGSQLAERQQFVVVDDETSATSDLLTDDLALVLLATLGLQTATANDPCQKHRLHALFANHFMKAHHEARTKSDTLNNDNPAEVQLALSLVCLKNLITAGLTSDELWEKLETCKGCNRVFLKGILTEAEPETDSENEVADELMA